MLKSLRDALYRIRIRLAGNLAVAALGLVRMFVPIRILFLDTARIAHMMSMANHYLRSRQKDPAAYRWDILICRGAPANETYFAMIARQARVVRSSLLCRLFDCAVIARPGHPGFVKMAAILHAPDLFASTRNPFELSAAQVRAGETALAAMGVPADATIVCFAVRDQAYLNAIGGRNWDYHAYRNGDLAAYVAAAEHLAAKGFWCLRLGSVVERALESRDSKVIDYASRHRTDFMDVYLGHRCAMYLGDNSGVTHFALMQGRGGVRGNLGLGDMFSPVPDYLSVPMLYRDRATGRPAPFKKCIALGLHLVNRKEQLEAAGVDPLPTSAEELIEAVDEWWARRNGTWIDTAEDHEMIDRFYSIYPPEFSQTELPRPPVSDIARIAVSFLRRHADLLPPADASGQPLIEKVNSDFQV